MHVPAARISEALRSVVDLTPRGIIERLDLARPIYRPHC